MHYIVYKITNTINGKIYIGCHKTLIINDEYMGSGKYLKCAFDKYGIENFNKEILFIFDNPNEMFEKEALLVNESFVKSDFTYNIKMGGYGGWDYINKNCGNSGNRLNSNLTKEQRSKGGKSVIVKLNQKISERRIIDPEFNKGFIEKRKSLFAGRKHTQATKDKISVANSLHQSKEGNSQFGTMWVTNGKSTLKIKKDAQIPLGYRKGRI